MKKTARSTIASARFACEGGSPRGFHDTKTKIDPTSRIDPKPLKKYPSICCVRRVGGGDGMFLPYSVRRRFACSNDRP
jgi:hypothetical protein